MSNPSNAEMFLRRRIDEAIAQGKPLFAFSVPDHSLPWVNNLIAEFNRRGWRVVKTADYNDDYLSFSRLPEYFNPVSQVGEGHVGELLRDTGQSPAPFEHYADQVIQGRYLYIYLHDSFTGRTIVAWAGHPEVYAAFYGQYQQGHFDTVKFYALSDAEISESEG